jgi:hypothetical protein
MHRRYNRWHARFDQPDPYDGSYNLTNPQSFNRYSYVQNDPVNFVDPLGLDGFNDLAPPPPTYVPPLPTGPLDVITTNTSDRRPGGGVGSIFGGNDMFVPVEEPEGNPGGDVGGAEPQNPVDTTEAAKLIGSCEGFLNAILAELANVRSTYSDSFGNIFTAASRRGYFRDVVFSAEQRKFGMGGTHGIIGDPASYVELDVSFISHADMTLGYTVIHELFHASAAFGETFSHFEMAVAAYNVAKTYGLLDKLKNTNGAGPPVRTTDLKTDRYNASIFDNILRLGCPIPK